MSSASQPFRDPGIVVQPSRDSISEDGALVLQNDATFGTPGVRKVAEHAHVQLLALN